MSSVFFQARARLAASWLASVVLPSPPTALDTMMTRVLLALALCKSSVRIVSTDSMSWFCQIGSTLPWPTSGLRVESGSDGTEPMSGEAETAADLVAGADLPPAELAEADGEDRQEEAADAAGAGDLGESAVIEAAGDDRALIDRDALLRHVHLEQGDVPGHFGLAPVPAPRSRS